MKPDKMEETLTCIICQELLHDCVRCAHRRRPQAPQVLVPWGAAVEKRAFGSCLGSRPLTVLLPFYLNG